MRKINGVEVAAKVVKIYQNKRTEEIQLIERLDSMPEWLIGETLEVARVFFERNAEPKVELMNGYEGEIIAVDMTELEYAAFELDGAKFLRTAEIQATSNALIAKIKSGYTDGEVSTFAQQYSGAKDILRGDFTTEDAEFVSQLAAARSMVAGETVPPEQLAAKIVENHAEAAGYTVGIIGKQQGLEMRVRAAETVDDVAVVVWD